MSFFWLLRKETIYSKANGVNIGTTRSCSSVIGHNRAEFFCNDFDNPMYSSIFAITSADMSGNSAQCLSLQPRQRSKTSEQKVREKNMRIIENSKNLNFVKFSLEQLHKAPKGQDGLKIKLIVYFFEN